MGLGYDFSKMLSQNPGASEALSDMAGEMQKLKGVPIMQVVRLGTTVNGQPLPAASEAPTPGDSGPATPSAGQVAKAGMSSVISSRLGGFGFGRKKKNPPPEQPADQNAAASQQPTSAVLMETQVTTSSFSSAPVDPSHFEVPAGYKQVQPPSPATPAAPPKAPSGLSANPQ